MSNRIGNNKHGYSAATCVMIAFAAAIGFSALLTTTAQASSETILYSFSAPPDGHNPNFKLIQDSAGNLYGATSLGGAYGYGTVFELSLQNGVWVESILHSFGATGDKWQPSGSLVMDKAGNLYGATGWTKRYGGVVYQLAPDGKGNWTEAILKTFVGPIPNGALTLDAAGNLYGVAEGGGGCGCGLVYRLSPPTKKKKWKYLALYTFRGPKHNDGQGPNGDLVFDAVGNLYGTTYTGGSCLWCGTVFELSPGPTAWTEKVLYSFQGPPDGGTPVAGVIFDGAGNLYGTTTSGGSLGWGVVFGLSPNAGNWTETVLYSFTGLSDGRYPVGSVTLHNGGLYGATESGGSTNPNCEGGCGVVFELSPSGGEWTEQVLHDFTFSPDGAMPYGGVISDSSGNLYGTTIYGGDLNSNCSNAGCGVVYEISP